MSPRLHFAIFLSLIVGMFAVPAAVMYFLVDFLGRLDYAEAAPYSGGLFVLLFSAMFVLTILVRARCRKCGLDEMRFEGGGGIRYRCTSCGYIFDTGRIGKFLSED